MPRWTPETKWLDQDVFIIGGGHSLESFDFSLLEPEDIFTIGCNDAYVRGSDVCNICFFGDHKWWKEHKERLEQFKGAVFTNVPQLQNDKTSWLWIMGRHARGLSADALGWNKNTGSGAVNLALLLGAKRVFLLGFDMHLSRNGKSNWHANNLDKPNKNVYLGFIRGFERLARDLPVKFPGREITNITDNSSLNMFPKIGVKEFWSERAKQQKIKGVA